MNTAMMRDNLPFRDRLIGALLHPVALLILPVALVASQVRPFFGPLGLCLYVAVAAYLSQRTAGERRDQQADVSDIILHAHTSAIPSRYGQWIARTNGLRQRIEEALERLPSSDRMLFDGLRQQAGELCQDVVEIAERAARLQEYLAEHPREETEAQIEALESHIANEEDRLARDQLEQARTAAESHLVKLADMERMHARMVAEATNIEHHMNNVLAEVMLVHAGVNTDSSDRAAASNKELLRLRSNIEALEQVYVGRRSE